MQTFWTSQYAQIYTLFSVPGKRCDPRCNLDGVITLTRLTESRLSGCGPGGNLSVASFSTDGAFVAPPAPSVRRLEILGDSISAGDLNDGGGAQACANSAFNDDITLSSAGQLCLPSPRAALAQTACSPRGAASAWAPRFRGGACRRSTPIRSPR